MILK
ncbi:Uncharacterised protein r2_g288 [Pycnogonum litorale]|jgi:hypothetical protein